MMDNVIYLWAAARRSRPDGSSVGCEPYSIKVNAKTSDTLTATSDTLTAVDKRMIVRLLLQAPMSARFNIVKDMWALGTFSSVSISS